MNPARCEQCGNAISVGARFCGRCGAPVIAATSMQARGHKRRVRRSAGAVGVLLLVGATLVVAWMTFGGSRRTGGSRRPVPSRAEQLAGIERGFRSGSNDALYSLVASSVRAGLTRTQFGDLVARQEQHTGRVSEARFVGRPRVVRAAVGPVMKARLRLGYANTGVRDYAAFLVTEQGRWRLWYTQPLRRKR